MALIWREQISRCCAEPKTMEEHSFKVIQTVTEIYSRMFCELQTTWLGTGIT